LDAIFFVLIIHKLSHGLIQNWSQINLAVLKFIGCKETNRQTPKQSI